VTIPGLRRAARNVDQAATTAFRLDGPGPGRGVASTSRPYQVLLTAGASRGVGLGTVVGLSGGRGSPRTPLLVQGTGPPDCVQMHIAHGPGRRVEAIL